MLQEYGPLEKRATSLESVNIGWTASKEFYDRFNVGCYRGLAPPTFHAFNPEDS